MNSIPTLRRLPPASALLSFLVVARGRSFSKAAEDLCLSQSSISRQIALLESYFNCRLLHRRTRQVALTEAGQRLLPLAGQILELFEEAESVLRKRQRPLTLRAHPSIASRWLLPRMDDFYAKNPDMRINLDTAWCRGADFEGGLIDAMLEYGSGPWPRYRSNVLWEEFLTPVARPGQYSSLGGALGRRETVLLHASGSRAEWDLWCNAVGLSSASVQHRYVDTMDLALHAARLGQGIALADLALIDDDLRAGVLTRLHPARIPSGSRYVLLYPSNSLSQFGFPEFVDWLGAMAAATRSLIDAQSA